MTAGGMFDETPSEITPQDYVTFLVQMLDVLDWIARHPDLLSLVRQEDLSRSLAEIRERLEGQLPDLPGYAIDQNALSHERLDGTDGRLKLNGWRRARDRFYDWMSRKNARRALRWGGSILDSLSTIVPILKPVQEIVQATDNLVMDAIDEAGA